MELREAQTISKPECQFIGKGSDQIRTTFTAKCICLSAHTVLLLQRMNWPYSHLKLVLLQSIARLLKDFFLQLSLLSFALFSLYNNLQPRNTEKATPHHTPSHQAS